MCAERIHETITGQLFFRDAGDPELASELLPDKKIRLMSVVGIVAVDIDSEFKGEYQYVVSGTDGKGISQLDIHMRLKTDLSNISYGQSIDRLLLQPIWRI